MFIDVFGDCIADTTKVTRFILQYEAYVQWPVSSSYYLKVLIICLVQLKKLLTPNNGGAILKL